MHIKIEDQETGKESVLCIDRTAKTAQILKLVPGHENLLIQVAQSVGATQLVIITQGRPGEGFFLAGSEQIWVKEL